MDRRQFISQTIGLAGATALEAFPFTQALARTTPKVAPTPFPEISASGSPGTIGLSHGRRFRRQIEHNVGFYLKLFSRDPGIDPKRALDLAAQFEKPIRKHAPQLLEEIDGIAKGAKLSRAKLLLVNARTEMYVIGQRKVTKRGSRAGLLLPRKSQLDHAVPGCTAMALSGGSTRAPLLALGQNWDWNPALHGKVIVLRIRRKGVPALVTLTEAGMVGKIGFNSARLGVCLNFLSHKKDDPNGPFGVPVHLLLRQVMECPSLAEVDTLLREAPRCASANFLVAQHADSGKGKATAFNYELTPSTFGRSEFSGRDYLVHTNHYLDATLRKGDRRGPDRSTSNRLTMANKLAAKLSPSVNDPAQRMMRILKDRTGAPYSVSRTPGKLSSSETLAGVVMDLSRNRLHLAIGPTHLSKFVTRPGV